MAEKSLKELVSLVENKEINIPELQREFVWSPEKVKDLANSIYNEYPIGLITLYKLPRELSEKIKSYFWVLDGQQRLLSLTLIFNGKVTLRDGKQEILWIWFNPDDEAFRYTRPPRRLDNKWVNLSEVLNMDDEKLIDFVKNRSLKEQKYIRLLWSRFKIYRVLIHEISEDLELDKLGEIFVRLNFSGTRVKGTDVYSTMLAIVEPKAVESIRRFNKGLSAKWGEIDYGILIRTFVALLTDGKVRLASKVIEQATKLKELLTVKKDKIEEISKRMEENVMISIHLILKGLQIIKPDDYYFPTENVLVTMSYYINKKMEISKEISEEEIDGLLRWFILASYFGRYSSATETRLDEDLSLIKDGKDYRALISKLEEYTGDIKERVKEDIERGESSRLLLYAFLRINKAKDLLAHQYELTTGDLTLHHLFPRSMLHGSELEELMDDVGNLTLTTMGTNANLSNRKPEEYLRKVPKEIRDSHYIPDDPDLWKIQNYKQFLDKRKEILIKAIDDFFSAQFFPRKK